MRKTLREKLADAKKAGDKQFEVDGFDGLLRLLLGGDPLPTQYRFICDPDRIRAYKGPAGCAKTSTLAAAGLLRALYMPGSKGFVSRNDYNDLMDTTAQRMEEMIARLPKGTLIERDKSPPMKWWIRPIAGAIGVNGEPDDTPSQITFMGLKDQIVGVEANWWIIDEADEVEEQRIHQVNTRLRHKGADFMIALAFNPPDKNHWLYTACTGKDMRERKVVEPWMKLYEPIPSENNRNLPTNYYETLAKTLTEDQRQRYVDGEWGATFEGSPVFREFKYATHVKDRLKPDPQRPLLRFWDFGYRRPYCVWAQLSYEGVLQHYWEYLGDSIEAKEFVARCQSITAERFPDCHEILDFGDPAAVQKKDTGSTLAVLLSAGIRLRYRVTTIEYGLDLMRRTMNTMINGEPAVQYDRRGCPFLIQALRGGYHMDEKGVKPEKDGIYDHPVDADRYGFVNVLGIHGKPTYAGSNAYKVPGVNAPLPTSVAFDAPQE